MSKIEICLGCGSKFESYAELIDHVVKVHDSNCQICGAALDTKKDLLKHNKEKHGI